MKIEHFQIFVKLYALSAGSNHNACCGIRLMYVRATYVYTVCYRNVKVNEDEADSIYG
jgi:hypothetical protein